jgi:tetratricopeptide (TPR) repeat protein
MTLEQLAAKWPSKEIGVNVRYVIEVEAGRKRITDIETLRKLASILHIPLWKLGLSEYDPFNAFLPYPLKNLAHDQSSLPSKSELVETFTVPGTTNDAHSFVQAHEDLLSLAWEAFYTSNAQRSTSATGHWISFLKQQATSVQETRSRNQYLMFLCRFLQLGSVLARDRADFGYGFAAIHEAIGLAFQLESAELVASSLYRRAKLYAAQQQYDRAIQDLEAALPYARHSRDPLRCYILMFLAEVYSLLAPENAELIKKSLHFLDEVAEAVRTHQVLEGDGSFVKVDTPGLFMIWGDVLRRAREIKDARQALHIVQTSLPKEFTRWQGNLHLATAQLFLAEGDVINSYQQLCQTLDIFQVINSRSGLVKTQRVYQALRTVEPSNVDVLELGERLNSVEHMQERERA